MNGLANCLLSFYPDFSFIIEGTDNLLQNVVGFFCTIMFGHALVPSWNMIIFLLRTRVYFRDDWTDGRMTVMREVSKVRM